MTGIGTRREHIRRLLDALKEIAGSREITASSDSPDHTSMLTMRLERTAVPETRISLKLDDCEGRVAAGSIIPYPPGIPVACPGEIITRDLIEYVKDLRRMGEKVIGVSQEGEVLVGE
ncbi:MAG: hypothetical protein J6Q41_08780 [Firmicutes bacterium]|nr:hypothetical protein [Bacillota bacterium]